LKIENECFFHIELLIVLWKNILWAILPIKPWVEKHIHPSNLHAKKYRNKKPENLKISMTKIKLKTNHYSWILFWDTIEVVYGRLHIPLFRGQRKCLFVPITFCFSCESFTNLISLTSQSLDQGLQIVKNPRNNSICVGELLG
jgi:hypothetical protein